MVTFNDKSFTIEVETGCNPIEDWLATHDELCDLLTCIDTGMTVDKNFIAILELLRQMMPDYDTAKRMIAPPDLPAGEESASPPRGD